VPPQDLKGTGHDRSMLERCVLGSGQVHRLTEQYRMHPHICQAISRCFYQGRVITATQTAGA
jgi:superfamily I DNA and/or RNA helicase